MYRELSIPFKCKLGNTVSINVSDNVLPHGFWEWLLLPFIVASMTLSFLEVWSTITILYGFVFIFLFLIYFLFPYKRLNTPPEVLIYFAWIIWSLFGMLNATNTHLYLIQLRTIIQMGAMIFLVAGIVALRRNIYVVMLAITIGGIIIALYSYHAGEFLEASYIASHFQVKSITGNPNDLAYHLLFVIFAVFCLWKSNSLWKQRIFLLSIIVIAVIGIIFSASRKGFLGVWLFMLLWFYFCQDKRISKDRIKVFLILLILAGLAYFTIDYAISQTYLGKRFSYLLVYGRGLDLRISLYQDGFDMLRKHPVSGVGLDQFRTLSSSGLYSHSDYLEVAVNTGIIGFALYFSIYVVLWFRFNRIKKLTADPHLLYMIGNFKAAIITILLVAFGRSNITSKLTWVFLASAIGYSWSIENALSSKLRYIEKISMKRIDG